MLQGYILSPFRSSALRLLRQIYYSLNASIMPGMVFLIIPLFACMSQSAFALETYFVQYRMPSTCLRIGENCVLIFFVPNAWLELSRKDLNPAPTFSVSGTLRRAWVWYPSLHSKRSATQKKKRFSSSVIKPRSLRANTPMAVRALFKVRVCWGAKVQKYAGLCGSMRFTHSATLFFISYCSALCRDTIPCPIFDMTALNV